MQGKHNGLKWMTSKDEVTNLGLSETWCKNADDTPCKCKGNSMQQRIIDLFHELRTSLNRPLTINSAYRCLETNKRVGGKLNSQHLSGKALDIKLPKDIDADQMEKYMEAIGATAIGKYKTFCHMDERLGRFRWDERQR